MTARLFKRSIRKTKIAVVVALLLLGSGALVYTLKNHSLDEGDADYAYDTLLEEAQSYDVADRPEEVTTTLNRAIKLQSRRSDAYILKAISLNTQGATASALATLETAIRYDKGGLAYQEKARILSAMGDLDAAMTALNHALAADPTLADSYTGRAMIYSKRGLYSLALADAEIAVRLEPSSAMGWLGKGTALSGLGRCSEALTAFKQTQALAPDESTAQIVWRLEKDPDCKKTAGI